MMVHTFGSVLALHDITVPDETIAELEIPVLRVEQRQGDVFIKPRKRLTAGQRREAILVTPAGVAVVRGEATGNTHLLHADPDADVVWSARDDGLLLGVVEVGEGSTAFLLHTDEHGANAMGPGTYELKGKREQKTLIQRVAD